MMLFGSGWPGARACEWLSLGNPSPYGRRQPIITWEGRCIAGLGKAHDPGTNWRGRPFRRCTRPSWGSRSTRTWAVSRPVPGQSVDRYVWAQASHPEASRVDVYTPGVLLYLRALVGVAPPRCLPRLQCPRTSLSSIPKWARHPCP